MTRPAILALLFLSLSAGVLLSPGASRAQDEFSFYGLKFGMTSEEAGKVMRLVGDGFVKKPGYGMSALQLNFDEMGRLMEIRAEYSKPEGELALEGLKRALREKFIAPARNRYPDLAISTDEYGNRAALTLVMVSKGIRESNIERHKNGFLLGMEPPEVKAQEKSP